MKSDSLYTQGMKPMIYSKKEAEFQTIGWQRFGSDIGYYPSKKKSSTCDFFTLSFTTTFKYEHDSVYIANCYPYTYTDLQ